MSAKQIIKKTFPWLITVAALYITFKDIDWQLLVSHVGGADVRFLSGAFLLTTISYFFRGRRWQSLFPECVMSYLDSTRVLTLGFFFNNVLPARAGEFVRAHLGAQMTGQSRALVLATIASERLVDGLTISLLFVLFAFGLGDHNLSQKLFYVALAFAGVAIGVVITIAFRQKVFSFLEQFTARFNWKHIGYTLTKMKVFVEGLSPLCTWSRLPVIISWSFIIWINELFVFYLVSHAYGSNLVLAQCILLMVAVNFSSLIPSAPGGIGVIEAVGTAALVSIGVPKELALIMVLSQHVIQYIVVCLPGAFLTLTWKSRLKKIKADSITPELDSRA